MIKNAGKNKSKLIALIASLIIILSVVVFVILLQKVFIPASNYQKAVQLYESGEYEQAALMFSELGDYKDSADKYNDVLWRGIAAGGETMFFGKYEQDNNTSNGAEDIEWLILDTDEANERVFLVSRNAIECMNFYTETSSVTWETSSIRTWLNNDFIATAFSAAEQSKIIETAIRNDDNPTYGTDAGNDTTDKVFLLSLDEVTKYFENDNARRATPSVYAINKGYEEDSRNGAFIYSGCTWWLLRTPGRDSTNVACVDSYGYILDTGVHVFENHCDDAIRPAMWISLAK